LDVASIYFKCFICTLQMFYVDVAKVDRTITCVAMTIHVCCKPLFQMSPLFQADVARVLCGYCICFTLISLLFHLDVAYIFTYILQMFRLDVEYVLQWLHTCFKH
jgi:hypothetical protein